MPEHPLQTEPAILDGSSWLKSSLESPVECKEKPRNEDGPEEKLASFSLAWEEREIKEELKACVGSQFAQCRSNAPRFPRCHRKNTITFFPTLRRRSGGGNMVSIRRRKLVPPKSGRRSGLLPLPTIPDDSVPENLEHSDKPVSVRCKPSAGINQSVEGKDRKLAIVNPSRKKQKTCVQIDPENPLEVHAYLMQLKEDNKLELGPMERSEDMPVKEWMEKCYPHIFGVFPQDPKMISEFADKSKQSEFLYCHYWLFLFEVRNIVLIDCSVSPEHVESLVNVIRNLEKQGFDCRFLRSELVVVRNMMKQQLEITLAVKDIISRRITTLETELQAVEGKEKEGNLIEWTIQEDEEAQQDQSNELQKDQQNGKEQVYKLPFAALEKEYFEVILAGHKKILEYKEEEGARLARVLEKINQLY